MDETTTTTTTLTSSLTLDTLYPDLFIGIGANLNVPSIISVARASKKCLQLISHSTLWQMLCIREFGVLPPTENTSTTNIGLANQSVIWREYFVLMYCSSVFTCTYKIKNCR